MTITTLSSRESNQDASRAKKAAEGGPVFITDRGRPAHVLLTLEEYQKLTSCRQNILDLLAMLDAGEVEFEPPHLGGQASPSSRSHLMYLLDTNVVSELRKAKTIEVNRHVRTWAKSVSASTLFLSTITILKLKIGILLIERRDASQGSLLRSRMEDHVLPAFDGRSLAVDTPVAQRCAEMHVPAPCFDRHSLIAATAMVHGMTVVTRNVSDFEPTGVPILNTWHA